MSDLEISHLTVTLAPSGVRVVDDVSLRLRGGEVLALVGESGSGKSLTALSLLGLAPPAAQVTGGTGRLTARTEGHPDRRLDDDVDVDLLALPEPRRRHLRGRRVAMVFQEPMTALNPLLRIDDQVGEALRIHRGLSRRAARARAAGLLEEVGVPAARSASYPHELSGGQRQRALIAAALACDPDILLADEPTTALDVTVQASVLALLRRLVQERGLGLLLITHDLGVVADVADRVAVMYGGQVVEEASVVDFFPDLGGAPIHPYSQALLASMPSRAPRGAPLPTIPGVVPPAEQWASGCRFRDRCPEASTRCATRPPLVHHPMTTTTTTTTMTTTTTTTGTTATAHLVACHQRSEAT